MAIEFECPSCGGALQVSDESAGKVIRCGGCMSMLRVPGNSTSQSDGASAPPAAPTSPFDLAPPPPPVARPRRNDYDAPAPQERPRPRQRQREYEEDPYDDRTPRTRNQMPPQPPRRVLFWLLMIGGLGFLLLMGCCGGLFFMLPTSEWQEHESIRGGFKVELPSKPKADVAQAAGLKLEDGTRAEGTILLRRVAKFIVVYRDIAPTKQRDKTDEQELEWRINRIKSAMNIEQMIENKPITVAGFPAREIEFQAKSGWHLARIIVADSRLYILLAGGGATMPGDADARRFIDSFVIIDQKLIKEGQRREREEKQAPGKKEKNDE